jgi:transcriptional regulator with PAS, ATPase and Fis domain
MSHSTQVKLLRVIQEKEFMRVGGTRVIHTNARLVTATNVDLREAVENGTFRRDLFYRLSVVPILLPALRQRAEDIPMLARYFLTQFRADLKCGTEDFDAPAMEMLYGYDWPGNVRELRNVVERMLVLHGKERVIRSDHLPEEFHPNGHPHPTPDRAATLNLADAVNAFERRLVEKALQDANGIQTKAAELLGTTRRILKYRMEKLKIEG